MCDWFRKYFPDSRYTLNVLYLKAHALDLRVDVVTLGLAPWIRYCDEFPSPASRKTWRLLAANGEATGTGAVAQLRLAQLESREPHTIDQAIDRLKRLINRLEASQYGRGFFLADGYDDPGTLDRSPPESGLGIPSRPGVKKLSVCVPDSCMTCSRATTIRCMAIAPSQDPVGMKPSGSDCRIWCHSTTTTRTT